MGILKGYLLDTHVLLWDMCGSPRLSQTAKTAISDVNIPKFISPVSIYEIMYKSKIGKLQEYDYIAENFLSLLEEFGAVELPISNSHAHYAGKMDWSHRDPFDRLLVAQACVDDLTLITNDDNISLLPWVDKLW